MRQGKARAIGQGRGDKASLSFCLIASALPYRWSPAPSAELCLRMAFGRKQGSFRKSYRRVLGRQETLWDGLGGPGRAWEGRRLSG